MQIDATCMLHDGSTETARDAHEVQRVSAMVESPRVQFKPGKGSHFKVTLNGKSTVFPDHGAKEIGEGLRMSIIKQLGLKD